METTPHAAPAPPPDLGGIITTADIQTKGTGSYAADYINWCRIAHLLHVHAPGWQFQLVPAADGQHVHRAPDGTGYLMGQFVSLEGFTTAAFPQAVMDNRNNPIPLERISARDVTDTHRRCMCTAAAAQFSLGWQLWAREPVEDPHRQTEPAPSGADLQAAVIDRLGKLGVDNRALKVVIRRASGGQAAGWGQVPDKAMMQLLSGTITPEKVQEWNDEAAAEAAEAADTPLTWTSTEDAKAAPRGRQKAAA